MSILKNNDPEYREWIQELSKRFRQSQIKAAVKVNTELIRFYWSLGEDIVNRQMEKKYGAGIIETISRDLQADFPNTKGFSKRNLFYARKFYLLYCERSKKVQQVVAQFDSAVTGKHESKTIEEFLFSIPWGHHCILIDKIENDPDKALFFVSKLNFYCTAVDHLLKGPYDQDTIGLLICKEKNDLVAKWTVEKNQLQPIGISEYELSQFLTKELPPMNHDDLSASTLP